MYSLKDLFSVLDGLSPIEYSYKMIEGGDYDNSGILVDCKTPVKKVLFSLDLSFEAVKKAKKNGCDTIVTHHPAIYSPLKSLSEDSAISGQVLQCAKYGINVVSMHLNLDVANGGIDQTLSEVLGGYNAKVLEFLVDGIGYGREFNVKEQTLKEYFNFVKSAFSTDKAVLYGKKSENVSLVASFCGGGSSHAEKYVLGGGKADVIVTSDMPHHVIKELIENDKKIILLPHYCAEEVGFKAYFERATKQLSGVVETCYFDDKRFR